MIEIGICLLLALASFGNNVPYTNAIMLLSFFLSSLYCLVECLSKIVWTHAVLGVLYSCVLYFCICTCSAQLSLFHMEKCSRNRHGIIIMNELCSDYVLNSV